MKDRWREELDALLANLDVVKTSQGTSKPELAIGIQLQRLRREYLLGELATRGFLPGYGFPTGVVPLVTSTIETLKRASSKQREDNRAMSRSSPSRPLTIAVRDYAPGTDTTLDGRVYRSGGVSLNWHLPAQLNAGPEIQSLRWVWLYTSCGAGYVALLVPKLPLFLGEVAKLLECRCDKACQACLLDHDTQHHVDLLDRNAAAALLDRRFLAALELPQELRAFGGETKLELEPLPTALRRELQRRAISEIHVHLGGETEDWEPLAWFQRQDLARWISTGITVTLIIPKDRLDGLSTPQADELAAVAAYIGSPVVIPPSNRMTGAVSGLSLILEVSGPGGAVRWAASKAAALVPTSTWGGRSDETRYVLTSLSEPLPEWPRLAADQLRRPVAGVTQLAISNELDGSSLGFGQRAWDMISPLDTQLADRLRRGRPITGLTYSDRYLKSPLNSLLLHSLLTAFGTYPGGVNADTQITLLTEPVRRDDSREPSLMFHDWRDAQVRQGLGSINPQ